MAEMQASRTEYGSDDRVAVAVTKFTNISGALVSMALLAGIGHWGYQVIMRDVSGVPVVRALSDPMREAPAEPGGREAAHQGLSVNRVAAQAATEEPPDRVIIAPPPLDLTLEDIPSAARAAAQAPTAPRSGDVHLAVVRQPAQATPRAATEPTSEPEAQAPTETVEGGLGRSLRPQLRPALPDPVTYALAAATSAPPVEVDPDSLPAGSRLAQLGAFDSAEVARSEWERLTAQLGDLLDGKRRVVQRAESGGRIFYRLRAAGFEDLADARRFCSALQAERAECIPVVTR
ncbi:SPOR domain-containing protein [Roseovarius sp. A46]|uniref:SPOR domain-containing protein n=1 Tax=Roseovarius sp. A46 TaxID=2109331 RepID=UPI00101268D2|nr:SPOR domain-containing protein [Roseovarius sp. A46]RXV61651.1 SPOR domain-containing protein [Roseovarius sp. A46]